MYVGNSNDEKSDCDNKDNSNHVVSSNNELNATQTDESKTQSNKTSQSDLENADLIEIAIKLWKNDSLDELIALLECYPSLDLNQKGRNGYNLLHLASHEGLSLLVHYLLDRGYGECKFINFKII